jgi:hypothetical protein
MRMTFSLLTALALGVAINAPASDQTNHTSSKLTLHFTGSGPHTLEVRDIHGRIRVEAYDGQDVEMLVDKFVSADTEAEMRDAARDVTLDTKDNAASVGVVVRYPDTGVCGEQHGWRHDSWPRYVVRYDFTVRVPKDTRLVLCTVNRGNVEVSRTQGDFEIRNVNGGITMNDVAGSGEATTVNGAVTASFISAPRSASTFKTINGGVSLTLPTDVSADFYLKTLNGGLFTDFEVQPQPVNASVTTEKHDGMFVYRMSGYTTVRAGKGGPELTLESLNGDIRVLRRQL